jgi:hypothetical protein
MNLLEQKPSRLFTMIRIGEVILRETMNGFRQCTSQEAMSIFGKRLNGASDISSADWAD